MQIPAHTFKESGEAGSIIGHVIFIKHVILALVPHEAFESIRNAAGFQLGPSDGVRVFSGCGEPTGARLFWCDGAAVWSNGGDTAYLLDSHGNVVDRYAF